MQPSPKPDWLPSFAADRGRRVRGEKAAHLRRRLEEIGVSLPRNGRLCPETMFGRNCGCYAMEIGFGGGEHLAFQAERGPETGWIGCEPYRAGVASLVARIDQAGCGNVRVFTGDARELMKVLPDTSLDAVYLLYPDPWPKTRHHKRRIVQQPFLDLAARVLKPGGLLRLVTDHAHYAAWMLAFALADKRFIWQARKADDWLSPPADWVESKFERKAKKEGRLSSYLDFVKL